MNEIANTILIAIWSMCLLNLKNFIWLNIEIKLRN